MTDGISNEPVIAETPAPISVEPRTASPVEVAETARQAEETKVADTADAKKEAIKDTTADVEKTKPLTTREAIRKAAEKVNAESAKPLSVAAAETKDTAKATETKDAKATDLTAKVDTKTAEPVAKTEPARAENGKFVSNKAPDQSAKDDAKSAVEPVKAALPSHTAEPAPKRFSPEAKEAWATAPETVRTEVSRMEKELTAGFEKHRAAAERDGEIAEFHDMATKGNTTVKEALTKYVGMENLLRSDTIKGLELICQNAGLSLRDVAAKVLGQTPDENASKADATIIELRNEIAELKKGFGAITQERQAQQNQTTHESVTKFAAENPRFDELANDITFFLKSGRTNDLAEAYSLAERLNPAPAKSQAEAEVVPAAASSAPPAVTKPTLVPPPAQTRDAGARSITGTPTAGSDPVRKQPSSSIKEAIRRATAAAG